MVATSNLDAWAHRNAARRQEATSRLESLPLADHARGKAVPFPYADRSGYQTGIDNSEINAAIESGHVGDVPLAGLHAIQHSVKAPRVQEYIDDPEIIPEGARSDKHKGLIDLPIVVQRDGVRYIHDGHHRLTADKLLGKREARVRFVNLDDEDKV